MLDAGGTLYGERLALESDGEVVVAAMNQMGYDAMAVGSVEFWKGEQVLMQRAEQAAFPVLSCNLVIAETGKLLLDPYVIIERGGLRIGLLGVTELDALQGWGDAVARLAIQEPVAAVQRYLPEVAGQSDLVILLSHLGYEEDLALIDRVPGIDLVVGGRSRKLMEAPEQRGATLVVQVGYDGEWLGRLDVDVDDQGDIVWLDYEVLFMRPDVPDDLEMARLVAEYAERFPLATPATSQ